MFQVNGDTIRIATDGSLLDGQHRLLACVETDMPFTSIVVRGLPSEVRATIDSGSKRTYGDRLSMRGVPSANQTAATLSMLASIATNSWTTLRLTPQELDMVFAKHPGVVHSVQVAAHAFPGVASTLSAVHYIGTYTGVAPRADAFVQVWKTGVPTYHNDPAHYLREMLIKTKNQSTRLTPEARAKLIVVAWNKFAAGIQVRALKLPDTVSISGWSRSDLGL